MSNTTKVYISKYINNKVSPIPAYCARGSKSITTAVETSIARITVNKYIISNITLNFFV